MRATLTAPEPARCDPVARKAAVAAFQDELKAAVGAAGYPAKADGAINKPRVVAILFFLVLLVTMVYGPIAALLVELFPTRIRYTVDVAALSYRQRLVRRLPAHHGVRDGRGDRGYLLRALVSGAAGGA